MAQRTSDIVELPAGHHPFLSSPAALAGALAAIARTTQGSNSDVRGS